MQLISEREQLPPMPKTHEHGAYKGHLPVIVFSVEEHRDNDRNRFGWQGWQESRAAARAYFEANADCQEIQIIFMNDEGYPTEADYGGKYLREQFEPGGKYGPPKRRGRK